MLSKAGLQAQEEEMGGEARPRGVTTGAMGPSSTLISASLLPALLPTSGSGSSALVSRVLGWVLQAHEESGSQDRAAQGTPSNTALQGPQWFYSGAPLRHSPPGDGRQLLQPGVRERGAHKLAVCLGREALGEGPRRVGFPFPNPAEGRSVR